MFVCAVELRLPENDIGEIHPDIRMLSNLSKYRMLRLFNQTTARLTLSFIDWLDLSGNTLSGSIPEFIYGMNSIASLDLSRTSLTGTLSSSISSLSNLGTCTLLLTILRNVNAACILTRNFLCVQFD